MTLLTPDILVGTVRRMIDPVNQLQPTGIDLTIKSIDQFVGNGKISANSNVTPKVPTTKPLNPAHGKTYNLTPGGYLVQFNESIHVPQDAAGVIIPKDYLIRSGSSLHSSILNPGYQGTGSSLLTVHHPISIAKNSRIGQIVFLAISKGSSMGYDAAFHGEGISE